MVFLSLDPSLSNTAIVWGEIVNGKELVNLQYKMVVTKPETTKTVRKSSDLVRRCGEIYQMVTSSQKEINAKVSFIETPSGSQNYSSALSYAVSCYTAAILSSPPIELTPTEVKVRTVKDKAASKLKMINYVHEKYPYLLKTNNKGIPYKYMEHVADAVCVAEAGLQSSTFKQLLKFVI